jgi:hydrogenase expression/formation protein HypC
MCLAIPGKVEELFQENGMAMAKVNFGGIKRRICMEYAQQAEVGQYVLVHVGFALSVIDEEEAKRSLAMVDAAAELGEAL